MMLVQLDKLERAGSIHANPTGEIREAGAAQSVVAARDFEPLALTEPIFECFARALSMPNCVGLSVADHLGEGRQSLRCRLFVRCGDGAGLSCIVDGRKGLP